MIVNVIGEDVRIEVTNWVMNIFFIFLVSSLHTFVLRKLLKEYLLLQTVKTQMKYDIMLPFIWVYTVCKRKKDLQTKETIFFFFKL